MVVAAIAIGGLVLVVAGKESGDSLMVVAGIVVCVCTLVLSLIDLRGEQ